MIRWTTRGGCRCVAIALGAILAAPSPAPVLGQGSPPADDMDPGSAWTFALGETATYSVAIGRFKIGEARLSVHGPETISGQEVVRTSLTVEGGPPFFRVEIYMSSWIDPVHLHSVRFERRVREGRKRYADRYSLDQTAGMFTAERWSDDLDQFVPSDAEEGGAMPADAIDEIAFFYLVRTLPLEPGATYSLDNYFKPDSNPIVVRVLGRERIRVPAGHFETVVVEPIIPELGVFQAKKKPRVWITDDERRLIVKMRSSAPVGPVALNLTDYEEGGAPPDEP